MPNEGNFENEKLSLDPVTVNSYGEVFRTIHKKKIRRRPFRDGTTIISACEMKLQILQTSKKQQIQKIIPHVDIMKQLTSPGIKVGYKLTNLFQSETLSLSEISTPNISEPNSTVVGEVFGMLPASKQPTEGAELFEQPPGGEQDEEEIGDNGEYLKEGMLKVHTQNSPLDEIRSLSISRSSPSSGSDWSPGGIEMNEETGFWSIAAAKNKHQGHFHN